MPTTGLTEAQMAQIEKAAIEAHEAFQMYWERWSYDHDRPFTRASWEDITPYMRESWVVAAAAALMAAQGPIYRHQVSDGLYEVLGTAQLQVATPREFKDHDELVVYRGAGGQLWVRPPDEFADGRFVPVVG